MANGAEGAAAAAAAAVHLTPLPPSAVEDALVAAARGMPAGVLRWELQDTDDSGTCQDAAAALGANRPVVLFFTAPLGKRQRLSHSG